ncbi:MAG: DUF424 domain-containing protein [Candidatus Micrarchaeia archaeon]
MLYIKTYTTEKGSMLAMCDEKLIGKVIEEGDIVIDLDSYADFYKGDLVDVELAKERINKLKIHTANIIGDESVGILIEEGIVKKGDVGVVAGVPYVHIYRID